MVKLCETNSERKCEMSVNGIKIKVGQRWRTSCGVVSRIMTKVKDDTYPFVTEHTSVTKNGRAWIGDKPNDFDLVELINDDAEQLAAETLSALGYVFDGQGWVQETSTGYEKLADVLNRALLQASQGKGRDRHAVDGVPFEEQPMATINRQLGSVHGFIYQSHKKSLEAMRLPAGRDVAELLGAINYLAGAVIALESWARKSS